MVRSILYLLRVLMIPKPIRLKKKRKKDRYNENICAVSRCKQSAFLVDASQSRFDVPSVPLCAEHWALACDAENTDAN